MRILNKVNVKKTSYILWLLPLMFIARQTIFVRQRAGTEYAAVDDSALVQIAIIGLICSLLLINHKKMLFLKNLFKTPAGRISLYYLFAAVSALWSFSPLYSAYMGLEAFIMIIFVFYLTQNKIGFIQAESIVLKFSIVALILSIYPYFSSLGLGLYHTNSFSIIAAMMVCYCFGELPGAKAGRKKLLVVTGLIGLTGLIVGTSTGSNIAVIIGLLVVIIGSKMHKKYLIALVIVIPLLMLTNNLGKEQIEFIAPDKSVDEVLSGKHRLTLWSGVLDIAMEKPFLGYGFGVGTKSNYGVSLRSAHNSFLEVLVGTGIIGLIIYSYGVVTLLLQLMKRIKRAVKPGFMGFVGLFVAYMVNNQSAPSLGFTLTPNLIIFLSFLGLYTFHVSPLYIRVRQPVATIFHGNSSSKLVK